MTARNQDKPAALETLARFAAGVSAGPEPAHHAKRAVVDWLAAIFPGTRYDPSPLLAQSLGAERGQGGSSLVGLGATAFPASAAWVNGTAAHAAELDDIYREAIYHPGAPTVAAALAVAEDSDSTGAEFLAAVIAGYEVACRVGAAVQPAHNRFFHATGTLGCIGAATAAAKILCPGDPVRIGNAIAIATSFASGLQEAVRSETMTKPIHSGHAAATGVRAAQAAACGATGAVRILDGPAGFAAALADGAANWGKAVDGLGQGLAITRATHKIHACCGHLFPVIDSVLAIRGDHPVAPEAIASIEVTTYRSALEATARPAPRTAYECKFSMPYVIAHALKYGSVGLDAFSAERMACPEIRATMALCTLRSDDAMSAAFPAQRHAHVVIRLRDGRSFEHRLSVRRGDPEAPLADEDLNRKFRDHVAPLTGAAPAEALLERVWGLDGIRVRDLGLREISVTA